MLLSNLVTKTFKFMLRPVAKNLLAMYSLPHHTNNCTNFTESGNDSFYKINLLDRFMTWYYFVRRFRNISATDIENHHLCSSEQIEEYIQFSDEIINKRNSDEIKISIVTPNYNGGRFLNQLRNSLIRQTIARQVEWVIVDDGSTDESMMFYEGLINEDKLGAVRVFRNFQNLGASKALNIGFSKASADVIGWVSVDDYYESVDKLEKDLGMIQDGADVVYSSTTLLVSEKGRVLFQVNVPNFVKSADSIMMFLINSFSSYINSSSLVMKRELFEQLGGFNTALGNVDGDFDLFARAALLRKKIEFSNTRTAITLHKGQTSQNYWKMFLGANLTRLSYTRFLINSGEKEELYHSLKLFLKYFKHYKFAVIGSLIRGSYYLWLKKLMREEFELILNQLSLPTDVRRKMELAEDKIYQLSDEFMQTVVFQKFAELYKKQKEKN